jgi:succinyl-diaminopimelate desuccinylase
MFDPVHYTQKLIAFDTINPPGNELACAEFVAKTLEEHGFDVRLDRFETNRANVIAKLDGMRRDLAPLVFTGHLDTVPLGQASWSEGPFGGEIKDGKLYGRGASDMKSGVAAMMAAAIDLAKSPRQRGITLLLTAGEETGCTGAIHLVAHAHELLGRASAMIVGEPTENQFSTAHKGALYMRASTSGVTAHSSTPHLGDNAVYKIARAITKIEDYGFNEKPHPLLGTPTINVGKVKGGLNVNSVPDSAEFTIDIRTHALKSHQDFYEDIDAYLGDDVQLETFTDMPAVSTAPDDPFTLCVRLAVKDVLADGYVESAEGLPFFTDASAFQPHFKCPTIILGPGELSVMHQTDEFVYVHRIHDAVEIYRKIARAWCLEGTA